METATAVKGAMIPERIDQMGNSRTSELWLSFRYGHDDKIAPYKWPKVIKYAGNFFQWMSYNSDSMLINYKEVNKNNIAFPA